MSDSLTSTNFKNPYPLHQRGISFEGMEACGKSTLIHGLKNHPSLLSIAEIKILKEPGSTVLGEALRNILLDKNISRTKWSETLLFLAARLQLLDEIKSQKNTSTILFFDRYVDSTLVYQGIVQNLGLENLLDLHQKVGISWMPQITFYLQLNLSDCLIRLKKRNTSQNNYFENWSTEKLQKIIDGYDSLAKRFPERFVILDASLSPEKLVEEALNHIRKKFGI